MDVAALSDDDVAEQLGFHHVAFDVTADAARHRELLVERINDINTFNEVELELMYPGITPGAMYSDAYRNLAETLHFEMRVSERIIWELFSWPLKKTPEDETKNERITRAAHALRDNTNFHHFDLTYIKSTNKSELERIALTRAHAKTLMRELGRTSEEVDLQRPDEQGYLSQMVDLVMPILVEDEDDRQRWSDVLT